MILFTSESSRRKELLQQIGFRVVFPKESEIGEQDDVIQKDAPFHFDYHEHHEQLSLDEARRIAIEVARKKVYRSVVEQKSLTTLGLRPEEIVVAGADTVVYADGRVLDRPLLVNPRYASKHQIAVAEEKARQMLARLAGKTFFVMTGLVLAQGEDLRNERACCVVTEATMKPFTAADIERYIQTGEPLDKAGGFGIQERGVALFEKIKGSYSNVVGLPLIEFVDMLRDPMFAGRVRLRLAQPDPQHSAPVVEGVPTLRVVSIGDINYDLAYNEFPAGFFSGINAPGAHVDGELYRAAGGTAAIFALRARRAGFKRCAILGVIGGDALGKSIEEELNRQGIRTLLPADYSRRTSIALILRDRGEKDTAVTLTDAHQALSLEDVQRARPEIEAAHVLFISGYCLTDPNRRQAALRAIELAKEGGGLVVVDVTVDMNKAFALDEFLEMTQAKVDVLVAEIPTVLAWLGEQGHAQDEWDFILDQVVPSLRGHFPTLFLRTSTYTYEIIASPAGVTGPVKLDYAQRPASQRLGYADEKTSQHLYQFMSPRVLSASASPRRLELLKQIVAENKIEVLISDHAEAHKAEETPTDRVKRLALEKARRVLARREEFSPGIELVIGADTEIVLGDEVVGHPGDAEEARQILRRLSGKTHEAITGLAVLDTQNGREFVDAVSTRVTFKTLSRDEIEQYVASGEPVGKAGAYGIQGKGALFVQEIDGSYSNVVGLPLEFLCEVLDREFGKPIWEINKVSSWRLPCGEGGETQ